MEVIALLVIWPTVDNVKGTEPAMELASDLVLYLVSVVWVEPVA